MLIIQHTEQRASKDESCHQCGKTIRSGTNYFRTEQHGHYGKIICSQNCLQDYSAPIQDSIPTFEKSLLGKAVGFAKKKALGDSSKENENDDFDNSYSEPEMTAEEKIEMEKIELKRDEQRAKERAEEERLEFEKKKYEDEKENKKKQERLAKAERYRKEGKNFKAMYYEYNAAAWGGAVIGFIAMFGFIGFMVLNNNANKAEAKEINMKLEQLETQIQLSIKNGEDEKALELINQLVHPSDEIWEGKGEGLFEQVHYDEYWEKKREKYKNQILKE
jgi:hypothetical protein